MTSKLERVIAEDDLDLLTVDSVVTSSTDRKVAAKVATRVFKTDNLYEDLISIGDTAVNERIPVAPVVKKQVCHYVDNYRLNVKGYLCIHLFCFIVLRFR